MLESGTKESRAKSAGKDQRAMKLAKADTGGRRLALDWDLLGSSTTLTLQGDTTYLVSSTVNISGVLTIEGGTVVKYTNTGVGEIIVASSTSNIVCQTRPFGPAAFTSMNDNSVGVGIPNSTGVPNVASTYLSFTLPSTQPLTLRYLRFSYASTAIAGTVNYTSGGERLDQAVGLPVLRLRDGVLGG